MTELELNLDLPPNRPLTTSSPPKDGERSRREGEDCVRSKPEKQARHLEVGGQNRPLHKLWWEIKAPDRAVTEAWCEKVAVCQHQSPPAIFLEKADPSLSWGKPGVLSLPLTLAVTEAHEAQPLPAVWGPHLTGHGAPGRKDGVFPVPEVNLLPWNHQAGQSERRLRDSSQSWAKSPFSLADRVSPG